MKGLAIASLVLGIIGFITSFLLGLGIFSSIGAIGFGLISLFSKEARKIGVGGLVLGIIGTIISLGFLYLITKQVDFFSDKPEVDSISKKEIKLGEPIRIGDIQLVFTSVDIAKTYDTGREVALTGAKIIK